MVSPEIHSTINDVSAAAGLRGKIFENWNFDLSNTYGKNRFDYNIQNTSNDLKRKSPTEFDAGGLGFLKTQPILMLVENLIN
jgi:iron complex outermembrane receptor protein